MQEGGENTQPQEASLAQQIGSLMQTGVPPKVIVQQLISNGVDEFDIRDAFMDLGISSSELDELFKSDDELEEELTEQLEAASEDAEERGSGSDEDYDDMSDSDVQFGAFGADLPEAQTGFESAFPSTVNQFFGIRRPEGDSYVRNPMMDYLPMDLGTRGDVAGAAFFLAEAATDLFGGRKDPNTGLKEGFYRDVKAKKARANLCLESGEGLESQDHPDMLRAKALTGGYIDYLRKNATSLLKSCEFSDVKLSKCARYAKLVAYMRARPSMMQTVDAERECAYRLASQFIRLANCLGVVFNRSEVDDDILKRTRRVALDTARGPVMEMTHIIYEHGEEGIEPSILAKLTTIRDSEVRSLLRFLRKIKVVEPFESVSKGKSNERHTRKVKWRLTDQLTRLYEEVME